MALSLFLVYIHALGELQLHIATPSAASEYCLQLQGLPKQVLEQLDEAQLSKTQWSRLFPVYLGDRTDTGHPAMLGAWHVDGASLYFKPRFPFLPGRQHSASFDANVAREFLGESVDLPDSSNFLITIPKPERDGEPAEVEAEQKKKKQERQESGLAPDLHSQHKVHISELVRNSRADDRW